MAEKEILAVVIWVDLSGGFWGLKGEDGLDYEPVEGLPEKAKSNGTKIRAKMKKVNTMSVHMWGRTVKLSDVSIEK